jgi:hypothetical protein
MWLKALHRHLSGEGQTTRMKKNTKSLGALASIQKQTSLRSMPIRVVR